jgi:hypothetical protein
MEKTKQKPIPTEIKKKGNGSGYNIHLENFLVISQKQHWNGIHKEPGKEDTLEQHSNGQC